MSKELDKALIAKAEEIAKNGTTMEATQFLNGADFYKKNIWHDASEEPKGASDKKILVLFAYDSADVFEIDEWEYLLDPIRWAYIDDLITNDNE